MSTRSSLVVRSRAMVLAVLVALLGFGTMAHAAPSATSTRAVSQATRQKMSTLAKTRDRNEKGQFLPTVKAQDANVRAYEKYEARTRLNLSGNEVTDYTSAKRELQNEKMASNKAAREAQKASAAQ